MTALQDCRDGRISPQVAVARMLLAGEDAPAITAALDAAAPHPSLDAMRSLVTAHRAALNQLAAEVSSTAAYHSAEAPTAAQGVARIAAFFDRAVHHSPEASVALYSLGDPAILAAATAEITAWLGEQRLLPPDADVLDLGCGIGRIAAALAPHCRSILALDVSRGMVAETAARLAAAPNVTVRHTPGENLDALDPEAFDLILAIDSFPYIIQADAALPHVRGAARALRPGGHLCILNLSYRGDPDADHADVQAWAKSTNLTATHTGTRPFQLWDGNAYVLQK